MVLEVALPDHSTRFTNNNLNCEHNSFINAKGNVELTVDVLKI